MNTKTKIFALLFCLLAVPGKAVNISGAAIKRPPVWGTLLQNRLVSLSQKNSVKPIASLSKAAVCQIDPFKEKLLHHYGIRLLKNDTNAAGASLLRFASYLRCISRSGMRDWENMFVKLHKDFFKADAQTKREGLQATINPALMVVDDLLYTGWSKFQSSLKENFADYNSALSGSSANSLFCSNHDGSVLKFDSPSIISRAAMTVANQHGELGLGLCSLCEMASANFEGFCDKGVSQLIACLTGAQKGAVPQSNGEAKSASPSGSSAAGGALSQLQNVTSSNAAATQAANSILGMSESELRGEACGASSFGRNGGMGGSLGHLSPSSGCSSSDMAALLSGSGRVGVSQGPEFRCLSRYAYSQHLSNSSVTRDSGAGGAQFNPLDGNCSLAQGNGQVGVDHVSYQHSEDLRAQNERGESVSIHVDWTVQVDHENDYQTSVQGYMINDQTGNRQLLYSQDIYNGRYIPSSSQFMPAHSVSGNLSDRGRNSQIANVIMNEARSSGTVTSAHCEGLGCSKQNADQANANERARADEQRRRQAQASSTPKGGTKDAGPDDLDTCSAEGRMAKELGDCVDQEENAKRFGEQGPLGGDGKPLGWTTTPNPDEGGGSFGWVQGLACFFGGERNAPNSKIVQITGAIDTCMYDGDPTCNSGGPAGMQHDWRREGMIDPNPGSTGSSTNSNNPCPSIPTPGRQQQGGCTGGPPGGGDTD